MLLMVCQKHTKASLGLYETTNTTVEILICLEFRLKAGGILHNLQTFNLLFGVMLSQRYFGITDTLSQGLQGQNVTTFGVKHAAKTVC